MNPTHVTLEPNEHNEDGTTVTLYFPEETTDKEILDWVHANPKGRFCVWYDLKDKFFEVQRTTAQPFEGQTRVQCYPTC